MKKIILIMLSLLLMICLLSVSYGKTTGNNSTACDESEKTAEPEYVDDAADGGNIMYGDANGDGKVTASDIVRLKKYFAGFDPDYGTSKVEISDGADANGDGKVTSSDIVRLKKYFAEFDPDTGESSVVLGKQNISPLIGDVQNDSKVLQDEDARSVSVSQLDSNKDAPYFTFYENSSPLSGSQWAVTGKINAKTVKGKSGHIVFVAEKDGSNIANLFINRRVEGVNGIYRNITDGGVRTPASGNTKISNDLEDSTDWTAEFAFIFSEGKIELYLREPGEEFQLMTSYSVSWETCAAKFTVVQYADVLLTELSAFSDAAKIKGIYNRLSGLPEEPLGAANLLFIGNSATSVNDIPQLLSRLSRKAGYDVTASSVTLGGGTLTQHADETTAHGQKVRNEIAKGYDIVFLQEVTSCISSAENRAATLEASRTLDAAIKESGAETYFYVRPPMKKSLSGYDTYSQCVEYDKLFVSVAEDIGATNVYVNRAFAYAVQNYDIELWGDDNAHANENGAYLIACVFFSTLFDTSSSVLDHNGLPDNVALSLQQAADQVTLNGYVPEY